MAAISQTTFSNAFFTWKYINFAFISLKFVPKVRINNILNILALVQRMASRRPGDKPLSESIESMMVSSLTLICVTRPR